MFLYVMSTWGLFLYICCSVKVRGFGSIPAQPSVTGLLPLLRSRLHPSVREVGVKIGEDAAQK